MGACGIGSAFAELLAGGVALRGCLAPTLTYGVGLLALFGLPEGDGPGPS